MTFVCFVHEASKQFCLVESDDSASNFATKSYARAGLFAQNALNLVSASRQVTNLTSTQTLNTDILNCALSIGRATDSGASGKLGVQSWNLNLFSGAHSAAPARTLFWSVIGRARCALFAPKCRLYFGKRGVCGKVSERALAHLVRQFIQCLQIFYIHFLDTPSNSSAVG